MPLSSPTTTLLRAVPNLNRLLISDAVAAFILDHARRPSWLGKGEFKQVIDLGNGTVARVYRDRFKEIENAEHPDHPYTSYELIPSAHAMHEGIEVDLLPKLEAMTDEDARHLAAVLQELGIRWEDFKAANGGRMSDGSAALKFFDGPLSAPGGMHPERMYTAKNAAGDELFRIIVRGHAPVSLQFYREIPPGPRRARRWVNDSTLIDLFHNVPGATGIWLTTTSAAWSDMYPHIDQYILDALPRPEESMDPVSLCEIGESHREVARFLDPATVDSERMLAKEQDNPFVRAAAIRFAKSDLTRWAFLDDPDPQVRWAAVVGAHADEIRRAVIEDPDEVVRFGAVVSARDDTTRMEFLPTTSKTILRGALLASTSELIATKYLEPSFCRDPELRVLAYTRLKTDLLRANALHDASPRVRVAAVTAATSDRVRWAFRKDSQESVRLAVVHTLRSQRHLSSFYRDPSTRVRLAALDRLRLDDPMADTYRGRFVHDQSAYIRECVVKGAHTDALRLAFLDDPEEKVRMAVANSVQTRVGQRAVQLRDADPMKRRSAARHLDDDEILRRALDRETVPAVQSVIRDRLAHLRCVRPGGETLRQKGRIVH